MATDTRQPAFSQWTRTEFGKRYGAALAEMAAATVIEVTDQQTGEVLYVRASRKVPADLAHVAHLIKPLGRADEPAPEPELVG